MGKKQKPVDRGDGGEWYLEEDEERLIAKSKIRSVEQNDMDDLSELLGRRGKKKK